MYKQNLLDPELMVMSLVDSSVLVSVFLIPSVL